MAIISKHIATPAFTAWYKKHTFKDKTGPLDSVMPVVTPGNRDERYADHLARAEKDGIDFADAVKLKLMERDEALETTAGLAEHLAKRKISEQVDDDLNQILEVVNDYRWKHSPDIVSQKIWINEEKDDTFFGVPAAMVEDLKANEPEKYKEFLAMTNQERSDAIKGLAKAAAA